MTDSRKPVQGFDPAHSEIYALYELARIIGTTLGVPDTMEAIAARLPAVVPFSCVALFLYDGDTDSLRCRFAKGTDAGTIRKVTVQSGEGLTGWVAHNRRPIVNARPSADLEAAGLTSAHTSLQSALVCPLLFNDRLIGTLAVYHVREAFYRDDHWRLLDRVSELAAAVINNSLLFEQAVEDALVDPLTGLPNERFLFMHLVRELARAERNGLEMAVLLLKVNNFREAKEEHGRHVAERALCDVARVLRHGIRPYDLAVRYASDEFLVVLSECGPDRAEQTRVEFHRAIEELWFQASPGPRLALDVGIGCAVFPHDGESFEALFAAADAQMHDDRRQSAVANRQSPIDNP